MQRNQNSFISSLKFRYLPYWPLFVIFAIIFLAAAYMYIAVTPPTYNVSATMSIKDERKGVEDSKLLESLNIYNEKTIVENETEVLHSKTLMHDVINNLALYAPISEKQRFRSGSAYTTSPISIQVKNPEKIVDLAAPVHFTYRSDNNGQVIIGKTAYALHQWLSTPYGILKFEKNNEQTSPAKGPLSFTLLNPGKLANAFVLSLVVSASSKTSTVIDLSFTDEVPKRGEQILNNLIDSYNKTSVAEKNKLASTTLTFLDERLDSMQRDLSSIENRIQKFKSQEGAVDLTEQSKLYLSNVGENDQKVADINVQLAVLDQIQFFAKANNNRVGNVPAVDDPSLASMVEALNTSEIEFEKLKAMSGENNPVTTGVQQRIETLKSDILQNIKTRRAGLVASRNNLASTNGGYSSSLQLMPQKERELVDISRELDIKNDQYSFLLKKREETALSYASTVAEGRVVDPAQAEETPVSPKASFAYLAALMAAMGLGVGVVSLKELFSSKVLFRNDIEDNSDLQVVAELANIKTNEPIAINSPNNFYITEQFRHLRASIGLFSNKKLQKKIMVTSSIAGEGKSFVSSNLAVSLAATRKKVILVDLDLRNPKASEIFKVSTEKGVVNFLEGDCAAEDIVAQTTYKNLSIIAVGIVNSDPTELLLNEKLNELFQYLEANFDYIIIDTAPIDPVADAYLLTEYCDMTLFVVRYGYTPKAAIQSLEQSGRIKELRNPLIVFNSIKGRGFFKKGYGQGYGYDNRYNYGNNMNGAKAIDDKKS